MNKLKGYQFIKIKKMTPLLDTGCRVGGVTSKPYLTLIKALPNSIVNSAVDRMLRNRDAMVALLHEQLVRVQQRMKASANIHRRDVSFAVGDMVYLKLRPYRHSSLARRINEKLAPRFYGPFQVIQQVGKVACKLQLPASSTIHPVFHAT